jgi:predicted PurR-regulated permease PerM
MLYTYLLNNREYMVKNRKRIERAAALIFIAAIIVGCILVLRLFLLSILWAAILCVATWPFYEMLLKRLGGRKTLVAIIMTLMLLLVIFVPFLLLGLTFTDMIRAASQWLESHQQVDFPLPPEWISKIPLAGSKISEYWTRLAESQEPVLNSLKPAFKAVGLWLLKYSINFGQGIFNLAMSVLIAFFLYKDGNIVAERLQDAFLWVSGEQAQRTMNLIRNTIQSVVYGTIGTALAQGALSWFGFSVAGVPSPMLLAMFVFFLSFVAGPPLVWIGAAAWLFAQGKSSWGIFMILYGIFVISGVDNFIKPLIISRGAKLPYIITLIGVLGGIATFGFIGVFLGPTLLAVGFALVQEILTRPRYAHAAGSVSKSKHTTSSLDV